MNKNIARGERLHTGVAASTIDNTCDDDKCWCHKGNPTEHLKMGITEFMIRNENLVREKNVIIAELQKDAQNAWKEFIDKRFDDLLREHKEAIADAYKKGVSAGLRWTILLGSVLSFIFAMVLMGLHYVKH